MREKNNLVDPTFARGKMYKKAMKEIIAEGVCPFCPDTFKWHTKPILKREGGWLITENFVPYKGAKYHFLIIKEEHIENLKELSVSDLKSVLSLAKWATVKFKIKGGGITMRFGDTRFTGATIKHLHFHLFHPSQKKGKVTPVYFPIG